MQEWIRLKLYIVRYSQPISMELKRWWQKHTFGRDTDNVASDFTVDGSGAAILQPCRQGCSATMADTPRWTFFCFKHTLSASCLSHSCMVPFHTEWGSSSQHTKQESPLCATLPGFKSPKYQMLVQLWWAESQAVTSLQPFSCHLPIQHSASQLAGAKMRCQS